MEPEEIERGFVDAGWEVPGPTRYPIVGNAGDLWIVAHEQYALSDDPVFEITDGRRMLSHWVSIGLPSNISKTGSSLMAYCSWATIYRSPALPTIR